MLSPAPDMVEEGAAQPEHEAEDWRLVGPLLDRPHESIDDIRSHSRAWAQQSGCKFKQQCRRFKGETQMLYAGCGEHFGCRARYKVTWEPHTAGEVRFKPHASDFDHASSPVVARADAQEPVTREMLEVIKREAASQKKRPLEIHMALPQPVDGRCVQNVVQNAKRPRTAPHLTVP